MCESNPMTRSSITGMSESNRTRTLNLYYLLLPFLEEPSSLTHLVRALSLA